MPFSESESMTIKRLEVALRKMDMQLLKDGAYKLHEKFHSGHKFEYIQELRQIYEFVQTKENIPPEICNILKATIENIMKKDEEDRSWETAGVQEVEYDNLNKLDEIISRLEDPKSALTPSSSPSLSPVAAQKPPVPPVTQGVPVSSAAQKNDVKPFVQNQPLQQTLPVNEVKESVPHQDADMQHSLLDKAAPVYEADINLAQFDQLPDVYTKAESNAQTQSEQSVQGAYSPTPAVEQEHAMQSAEEFVGDDFSRANFDESQDDYAAQSQQDYAPQVQREEPPTGQEKEEYGANEEAPPEVALFYDDSQTGVDFSVIKDYRNQLNALFSKNNRCEEFHILKQISSISNIIDTPINDVDKIISTLTTTKNKTSLLTTSQSQNFSKMLVKGNLDFEIPFVKKAKNPEKAYSVVPMLGFSNVFVCSNCNARTLKTDFNSKTLSVQCPECDGASFPDLYAVNSYNPDCNPIFWHRAFATLVKAKIWVLVNPPLDENKEVIFDFLKTAYGAASVKRIYLLSRENDKREFYKQTFMSINSHCDLRCDYVSQEKLCEDFICNEIMLKVPSR